MILTEVAARPEWLTQSREQAPSAARSSQSTQHSQQGSDAGVESQNDGIEWSGMAMEAPIACAVGGLRLTSKTRISPWNQQTFIGQKSDSLRETAIGKILYSPDLPSPLVCNVAISFDVADNAAPVVTGCRRAC